MSRPLTRIRCPIHLTAPEKAYFKYLYSDSMIHKAEPFVEDITNYLVTANTYEKSYQETKQIEEQNQKEISSVEKQKICFLFWCW